MSEATHDAVPESIPEEATPEVVEDAPEGVEPASEEEVG